MKGAKNLGFWLTAREVAALVALAEGQADPQGFKPATWVSLEKKRLVCLGGPPRALTAAGTCAVALTQALHDVNAPSDPSGKVA